MQAFLIISEMSLLLQQIWGGVTVQGRSALQKLLPTSVRATDCSGTGWQCQVYSWGQVNAGAFSLHNMFKIPTAPLLGNSDTANTGTRSPSSVTPELPQISSTGSEPNQWSQQGPSTGGQGQGTLHPELCWCHSPALSLDAVGSRDICSGVGVADHHLAKRMSLLFISNEREMRLPTEISACLERLGWLLRFIHPLLNKVLPFHELYTRQWFHKCLIHAEPCKHWSKDF